MLYIPYYRIFKFPLYPIVIILKNFIKIQFVGSIT